VFLDLDRLQRKLHGYCNTVGSKGLACVCFLLSFCYVVTPYQAFFNILLNTDNGEISWEEAVQDLI
jgi:hypothetical protein